MDRSEARTAAGLDRLLGAERKALREGRHELLPGLAARKAALVRSLARTPGGVALLGDIRPRLLRQQRLLSAALGGLHEVREATRRPAEALRTYGPDGAPGPADCASKRTLRRL
jgi:hypothetical protein